MTLSQDQLKRYSRHLALKEVEKQDRKNSFTPRCSWWGQGIGFSRFILPGGCRIGTIGILDSDRVDFSNLNRQILYKTKDVGQVKLNGRKYSWKS